MDISNTVHFGQADQNKGVTVVQYRDKTASTRNLIETAKRLHDITKEFGVPLIINDRIDVALAIGAEGIHVGQDDMGLSELRCEASATDITQTWRQRGKYSGQKPLLVFRVRASRKLMQLPPTEPIIWA